MRISKVVLPTGYLTVEQLPDMSTVLRNLRYLDALVALPICGMLSLMMLCMLFFVVAYATCTYFSVRKLLFASASSSSATKMAPSSDVSDLIQLATKCFHVGSLNVNICDSFCILFFKKIFKKVYRHLGCTLDGLKILDCLHRNQW